MANQQKKQNSQLAQKEFGSEQNSGTSPSQPAGKFKSENALGQSFAHQPDNIKDLVQLGLILVLALALRLALLASSSFGIESDEAIVGLMAKHITEGHPWPVFYYGQDYMGSIEPLLVAAAFSLFGRSNAVLCLVPLLFSLLHVALVYALARRFTGKFPAKIAALLVAIGPNALVLWGTKARGGFIELVVIGTLALILAVDSLRTSTDRGGVNPRQIFFLGLLLGIGWWMNNQIVFYMLPIGLCCGYSWLRQSGFWQGIRSGGICLVAFFLGGLPFWWANLAADPQWPSFAVLFAESGGRGFTYHLQGLFSEALPIIFGSRRFWTDKDVIPSSTTVTYILHGMVFLCLVLACIGGLISRSDKPISRVSDNRGLGLLLIFCVSVGLIFSASSFGWLSKAPRYLLPFYSVLFVLSAILIEQILSSSRRGKSTSPGDSLRNSSLLAKTLTCSFAAVLLAVQLSSNLLGGMEPGQPVVYQGQRVARDHQQLYAWLQHNGYSHIHTNYWIGYRTAFETDEEVTFTRFGRPRSLRIPEYEAEINSQTHSAVYVLVPAEAQPFANQLQQFGYSFRQTTVGSYLVIDQVLRTFPLGPRLILTPEMVSVTQRSNWVSWMLDGDLTSRWGSGAAQKPEMQIALYFAELTAVSGLALHLGEFVHDAPRGLLVEGLDSSGQWQVLADFRGTKIAYDLAALEFAEIPKIWEISFAPRDISQLRLRQLGSDSVFDWSVAELEIFGDRD